MNKEDPANCIFCKMFAGESAVSMVCEDESVAVLVPLHDVNPGHLLVVPRSHLPYLAGVDDALLMHLTRVTKRMATAIHASDRKCDAINLFLADGEVAGQEVFHLHLHVYPRYPADGFGFRYDPKRHFVPRSRAEMDATAAKIRAHLK